MATWRQVMPHYKIKLWNTSNFDIGSAPAYVQQACAQRKWAFAADYIRMWALYTEGGIYLDSDVRVLKPFDDMLGHNFFSSMEKRNFHCIRLPNRLNRSLQKPWNRKK